MSTDTWEGLAPARSAVELSALVPRDGSRPRVNLVLPDPRRSARTGAALVGLRWALTGRTDARRALAGLLEAATTLAGGDNLRAPLRHTAGSAVPATEQQVFAAEHGRPTPTVVAVYATGAGSTLDYPFAVLSRIPARQRQAEPLLAALHSPSGRTAVETAGFRDRAGRAGRALLGTPEIDTTRPGSAPQASSADIAAVENVLAAVKQDARLLAVMDVSGSMAARVPGADGATRLELAKRAAGRGLSFYSDTSAIGLWTFATHMQRDKDYLAVVPTSVLGSADDPASGRTRLAAALAGIGPTRGDTGLYDTALAAVRVQQAAFEIGRVNAVLLLTDGRNDDPGGVSLPQLLATLIAERDPNRPVPVIAIAYGPDSDAAALTRISRVTGGATYTAKDPRQIEQVFLDAISQRICRPHCTSTAVS